MFFESNAEGAVELLNQHVPTTIPTSQELEFQSHLSRFIEMCTSENVLPQSILDLITTEIVEHRLTLRQARDIATWVLHCRSRNLPNVARVFGEMFRFSGYSGVRCLYFALPDAADAWPEHFFRWPPTLRPTE